jgi:hypothetical protein
MITKVMVIGLSGSLILLTAANSWAAGSSSPTTYIEGSGNSSGFSQSTPVVTSSGGGFDLGNTVDFFNQKLDTLDTFVNNGISALGGEVGGLVDLILGQTSPLGNFLKDTAALGNLFTHRSLISQTGNFINLLKCSLVNGLRDLSQKT